MYEEEDDDMPFQYRRLTAHLQTNSADFNRRLQDYLTTHMAMRSALANSYAMNGQQFPGNQQFANAMMFPSPMLAHQQNQQQQLMQPSVMRTRSPTTQRQTPYPPPSPQQHSFHNRNTSIATQPDLSAQSQRPTLKTERSASVPTIPHSVAVELKDTPASATLEKRRPSFPQGSFAQLAHTQTQCNAMFPSNNMDNGLGAFGDNNYCSFSTALPAESQMFLGSTLNPNDPLTSMFMAGADPSQFYDFTSQVPQIPQTMNVSKHLQYPSFNGLNSTLAPSNNQEASLDCSSFFDHAMDSSRNGDFATTPTGTPGVNGESWASFIDTDQWDVPSSQ
jgi:hypothetical protein